MLRIAAFCGGGTRSLQKSVRAFRRVAEGREGRILLSCTALALGVGVSVHQSTVAESRGVDSIEEARRRDGPVGTLRSLSLEDIQLAQKLAKQNTSRKRRNHYRYVIIGAGTTSHAAIESILELEPHADILMLTDEAQLPRLDVYQRERPLPSDLLESYNEWRRHVSSKLEAEPHAFSSVPITLLLGHKRLRLDSERRALLLDDGSEVLFDQCLLATAAKPRQFYVLTAEKSAYFLRDRINTLSSWADFDTLQYIQEALDCRHVAVIGGGFLGTEIALALSRRGMKVSQVYAEAAPLCRELPIYLAEYVQQQLQQHGVEAISERLVTDVRFVVSGGSSGDGGGDGGGGGGGGEAQEGLEKIQLSLMGWAKDRLAADYVVLASTHADPLTTVAKESGLEIDPINGGIVVNGQLEAVGGIFAAGACASYYDATLGRRRVDMLDHSISSGKLAGYNMAASTSRNPLFDAGSQAALTEPPSPLSPRDNQKAAAAAAASPRSAAAAGGGTSSSDPSSATAVVGGANGGSSSCSRVGSTGGKGAAAAALHYPRQYMHQPVFRSHLEELDILMEGVGELDANLKTVGIWVAAQPGGAGDNSGGGAGGGGAGGGGAGSGYSGGRGGGGGGYNMVGGPAAPLEVFTRGVVYYLRGAQIAGMMLWNASDLRDKARDVLRQQPTFNSADDLKTLVALAPDEWLRIVETTSSPGEGGAP